MSKRATADLAGSYGLRWEETEVTDDRGVSRMVGQYVMMSEEERVQWELRTGEVSQRIVRAEDVLKLSVKASELVSRVGSAIEVAQRVSRLADNEATEIVGSTAEQSLEEALSTLNRAALVSEALSGRRVSALERADRVGEITMGGQPYEPNRVIDAGGAGEKEEELVKKKKSAGK
mgnify:CR=1 FL=1